MNLNSLRNWITAHSQPPAPVKAQAEKSRISTIESGIILVVLSGAVGVVMGIGMLIRGGIKW
jgi:hypothetical protein